MAGRTDVDGYIASCADPVAEELRNLRSFIHTELPGATEAMSYGVPVFLNTHGVPVIYLYGARKHVNFGFLRAAELSDPAKQLKGSGKPSKHIKLLPGGTHDLALLRGFVAQCAGMTESAGSS